MFLSYCYALRLTKIFWLSHEQFSPANNFAGKFSVWMKFASEFVHSPFCLSTLLNSCYFEFGMFTYARSRRNTVLNTALTGPRGVAHRSGVGVATLINLFYTASGNVCRTYFCEIFPLQPERRKFEVFNHVSWENPTISGGKGKLIPNFYMIC